MKESIFYLFFESIKRGRKMVFVLLIGFLPVIYAQEKKDNQSTTSKASDEVTAKEEIPVEVKRALATMTKKEQPKFFGAYKAGFTVFKRHNEDWFMLKNDSRSVDSQANVVFIGSLQKVRSLEKGKTYQSLISEISIDCKTKESLIRYLDYKQGEFGTGESVWTVRLQNRLNGDRLKRSFKNKSLQEFVYSSACN